MAKRKKGKGRRGTRAIPITGMLPFVQPVLAASAEAGMLNKGKVFVYELTGYNPTSGQMDWSRTTRTASVALIGFVLHKGASKIGVSRMMKKLSFGYLTV